MKINIIEDFLLRILELKKHMTKALEPSSCGPKETVSLQYMLIYLFNFKMFWVLANYLKYYDEVMYLIFEYIIIILQILTFNFENISKLTRLFSVFLCRKMLQFQTTRTIICIFAILAV